MKNRFAREFMTSVLGTNFDLVNDNWSKAQCQEVHHSVFKFYRTTKDLVMKSVIEEDEMPTTDFEAVLVIVVKDLLRPFLMEWHHILFKNKSFSGLDGGVSVPRWGWMPKKVRKQYEIEIYGLYRIISAVVYHRHDDDWLKRVETGDICLFVDTI